MRAAQKEQNQNAVQVTRDSQWVNTETLVFWYTARHRSVLEVYRCRWTQQVTPNVGTCQDITWPRISECPHLPVYNNSDVPAAATPVPPTLN
jgi:hypothetical protein